MVYYHPTWLGMAVNWLRLPAPLITVMAQRFLPNTNEIAPDASEFSDYTHYYTSYLIREVINTPKLSCVIGPVSGKGAMDLLGPLLSSPFI